MAKVRIQAGEDEDETDAGELPTSTEKVNLSRRRKHTEKGAIKLLTEVFKDRGVLGWYQVNIGYS